MPKRIARDAASEALLRRRNAQVDAVRAIHDKTHWCIDDGDKQANVYERGTEWWPCPTMEAPDPRTPPGVDGGES